MKVHFAVWSVAGVATLFLIGFAGWVLSLPPTPDDVAATPFLQNETAAALAALEPPKRERPLIAVIGINDATETTDYLVTTGILRRADVADVMMLATGHGPVQLYPALRVEPDATIAEFDAAHPDGADYVIVPAMSRDDDPAVIAWLQDQSRKGAKIIGVCAGAKVVGAADLLDGRRATTHWYYLSEMLKRSPTINYVADRRFVTYERVTTTTGITASIPMKLTLIDAIAGREKAEAVAQDLGLNHWDARHASGAFKLTRPFATTVLANRMAFWNREELGIQLAPGMDEVSLALAMDAWSRTYRSQAVSFAEAPTETRSGMRIFPDLLTNTWSGGPLISTVQSRQPVQALDDTLGVISDRYGAATASIVAMQLEYPTPEKRP